MTNTEQSSWVHKVSEFAKRHRCAGCGGSGRICAGSIEIVCQLCGGAGMRVPPLQHCDINAPCLCAGCEAHKTRYLALERFMRTGVRPPQCEHRKICILGNGHQQPCYAHEDHSGDA